MDYKCVSCGNRIFDDKGLENYIRMGFDPKKATLCEHCIHRIHELLDEMLGVYGDGFMKTYDEWENEQIDKRR